MAKKVLVSDVCEKVVAFLTKDGPQPYNGLVAKVSDHFLLSRNQVRAIIVDQLSDKVETYHGESERYIRFRITSPPEGSS